MMQKITQPPINWSVGPSRDFSWRGVCKKTASKHVKSHYFKK